MISLCITAYKETQNWWYWCCVILHYVIMCYDDIIVNKFTSWNITNRHVLRVCWTHVGKSRNQLNSSCENSRLNLVLRIYFVVFILYIYVLISVTVNLIVDCGAHFYIKYFYSYKCWFGFCSKLVPKECMVLTIYLPGENPQSYLKCLPINDQLHVNRKSGMFPTE